MNIYFKCGKCKKRFNCDVGEISLSEDYGRPHFEKTITCPSCGPRTMDDVYLTERSQNRLTEIILELEGIYDDSVYFEDEDILPFDPSSGDCQGCDNFQPLDDLGLCPECSAKLDRDLIRERAWEYSITAYVVREQEREKLRNHVVKKYGEKLELIAPEGESKPKKRKRKKKRKKEK